MPQNVEQLPQLHTIRQDLLIQAQVQKRLKELAEAEESGTQKQKSLRGGLIDVLVPNKVKWPHEYVLSGSHKECVSYDQLSIIQWVTGFCRIMRDEQDKTIQNSMLDYLIALFDDANDFSWDAAKASHAVRYVGWNRVKSKTMPKSKKSIGLEGPTPNDTFPQLVQLPR